MRSSHALTLFAIALACHEGPAVAADGCPSWPVRLIVQYAPGGGSDITARAVGQKPGEALGKSFVVDNRPGDSSMIGSEIVAMSPQVLLANPSFSAGLKQRLAMPKAQTNIRLEQ